MAFEIPQVFISSTSEFGAERREIARVLRALTPPCEPFVYEEESARGDSPQAHCAAKIDSSEVVVLVVGSSYGSSFPGAEAMSIVEWEYEYARQRDVALQAYFREVAADAPVDPRQQAFRERLGHFTTGSWLKRFRLGSELASLVAAGVTAWRNECWRSFARREPERRRWMDRMVLGVGAAVALATLGGVIAGVVVGAAASSLLVIAGTGLAMLVVLGVLLKLAPV